MSNQFTKLLTRSIAACSIFLLASGASFAQSPTDSNPVVAKVGSKQIKLQEVEDKQINELRQKLYARIQMKLRRTALEKLGKTHPEFNPKTGIKIRDAEVRDFYNKRNLASQGSYEQLAPQIKQYLTEIEMDYLYNRAVKKGLIVSYLKEPNEFLVTVPVETAYLWGKSHDVFLLEFSEYQCPFCARVQPTLEKLREKYKGRVTFAYRHLPLPFHKEATGAAIAVECARDQGQFNDLHKILFQNTRQLYIPDLKRYAKEAGVKDLKTFNDCLDGQKYLNRVENDKQTASKYGMNGTPSFVIGRYDAKTKTVQGAVMSGAQPESQFVKTIEKFLN